VLPPYDQIEGNAQLKSGLAADPKNTTLLNWYGMALQSEGYFEEGLALQRRCLDIDPGYANCVFFIENGLVLLGRREEAMAFSERYIEILNGELTSLVRAIMFMEWGNRSAAILSARDVAGLEGAPAYQFIKALDNPDGDHSTGLQKFENWAVENHADLTRYPEIFAAFGDFDRTDLMVNAEPWYWLPSFANYRRSDKFAEDIRKYGVYDLWKVKGFPPSCRPVGDDKFECD
jgi:tetratricopeptide (TPR) repeat protein